ncbi:MAG: hypothetical protein P4L40_03185 [Terracidiphilus sp.]|nr:hypothetical protein [Terracidiphilus sp.]
MLRPCAPIPAAAPRASYRPVVLMHGLGTLPCFACVRVCVCVARARPRVCVCEYPGIPECLSVSVCPAFGILECLSVSLCPAFGILECLSVNDFACLCAGDAGSNPGMQSLATSIMSKYPGSYATALDVADGLLSFLTPMQVCGCVVCLWCGGGGRACSRE